MTVEKKRCEAGHGVEAQRSTQVAAVYESVRERKWLISHPFVASLRKGLPRAKAPEPSPALSRFTEAGTALRPVQPKTLSCGLGGIHQSIAIMVPSA